ncbi:hypothetical protein X975_26398, partial [Stegodyphus mimosarum]
MVHPVFTTCAAFGVAAAAAIFILFTYEWRRSKPQPYRPDYDSADKRPSSPANDSDSADKRPSSPANDSDSADKPPSIPANDSDSADKPPSIPANDSDSAANRPATPTDHEHEKCLFCDRQANTQLFPCSHECMCVDCIDIHLKYDKKCPLCRINIAKFSSLP